ncbi:hypothetical protein MTR67_018191 [Solanum verrucosum]|uniref:Uncharacterized protein n=1 Tax=Solanum verrucosum TaxID=315347 RepID=A0AAF0QQB0_SOLVR|nr:hypothetical protein MTR67_018191 [Solanum verrucosum]
MKVSLMRKFRLRFWTYKLRG